MMPKSPNTPWAGRCPTFARLFRWLFSGRTFGRLLVGLAAVATLVALFYAEENWRGRRAWSRCRHELEAAGVRLDLPALWPKPVPDAQNFAATPAVRGWFENPFGPEADRRWEDPFSRAAKLVLSSRERSGYHLGKRQFMDLAAWEQAFAAKRANAGVPGSPKAEEFSSGKLDLESRAKAAPGVLAGLKTNEALFAELRTASRQPFARYPVNYDPEGLRDVHAPHLANLHRVFARLELRACAELAAGQNGPAFEDVSLMLYLAYSIQDEPLFYSQWTRLFLFQIAVQPVWEGLAMRAWSQPQLQALSTRLQKGDFLSACRLSLEARRAQDLRRIDSIERSNEPEHLFDYFADQPVSAHLGGGTLARMIGRGLPSGWWAQEKVRYCQFFQMSLRSGFDPAGRRVYPAEIEANAAEAKLFYESSCPKGSYPGGYLRAVFSHRFAVGWFEPDLHRLVRGFAFAQATADQATLACALEQYRLAHGQFPEKLEALMPQFLAALPKDVLTGESYKYRRTEDGRFLLYSVGWNEKDDGGRIFPGRKGSIYGVDLTRGDWVWPQDSALSR
jgi:hypothetical protein